MSLNNHGHGCGVTKQSNMHHNEGVRLMGWGMSKRNLPIKVRDVPMWATRDLIFNLEADKPHTVLIKGDKSKVIELVLIEVFSSVFFPAKNF